MQTGRSEGPLMGDNLVERLVNLENCNVDLERQMTTLRMKITASGKDAAA